MPLFVLRETTGTSLHQAFALAVGIKSKKKNDALNFLSPNLLCFENISWRQDAHVLLSKYNLNFHCLKPGICNMHDIQLERKQKITPTANRRQTNLVSEDANAREIFFQVMFSQ